MNRLTTPAALCFSLSIVLTSCSADIQNKIADRKATIPAIVTAIDVNAGEEFNANNLGSKLTEVQLWKISRMPTKESLYERRASRRISRGELVTIEEILPEDRVKWTRDDEARNQEVQNTLPGYENYYFSRIDIKKGEPILSILLVRRQASRNRSISNSASSKTDEYKGVIPADAIRMLQEVRGKKAKKAIKKKVPIRRSDLENL